MDLTARYNALRVKREQLLDARSRAEQQSETAQAELAKILAETGCASLEELETKAATAIRQAEDALAAAERAFA